MHHFLSSDLPLIFHLAGNSGFARKAEALALGITNGSTPKATDGAKGGPGQSCDSGGMSPPPLTHHIKTA